MFSPAGGSNDYPVSLRAAAPAVFRGGVAGPLVGLATVVRADNGQLVTPSNPIHRGDDIIIYAAGMGRTDPPVEAGIASPSDPPARTVAVPDVKLGSVAVPVQFAGLAPWQIGVYQINARIPGSVPTGLSVPLSITQSGATTSVDVRVVD